METIICTGGEHEGMIDYMTCVCRPYNEIIALTWQVEEYDVVCLVTESSKTEKIRIQQSPSSSRNRKCTIS